jgi:phospholipid-translocating P-type ATPase (flippase)
LKLRKYDKNQGKEVLEDLQVKVLKTLEFSSARGMMSTIAKVKDKIYCFSKGSDKKIEALLDSKKQPFKNSVQVRARKLSEKGLRVMWVAMKILDEKEFIEWNESYEKNIQSFTSETDINNFKFEWFQILESNLTLIGCTAVEDKLQDYVPETIKEIQTAGINFWVLTGDNLPTARNIGIMCNLLVKNMKLYEIYDDINKFKSVITALYPEETIFSEESLEKAKLKIACFENKFKDVYSHIQSKEYNNKKGILFLGLEKMIEVYENNMKSDAASLTGILVESDILKIILPNEKYKDLVYYSHPLTKLFLDLTLNSQAVICCRVSPKQKALVVRMVKNNIKNAITLAIGDGANDVSMIMEASVGVGIYGEEGTQAAMSSDYAIGEFKCLRKLVLFHGRYNYLRIAEMIIYFFYKNFIFTIPQFYYAFETAFSGQTVFDEFFVALYNMSFTSFPLLFKALLEKDICFSSVNSSFVKNFIHDHLPYTFYLGRESITFSFRKFFKSIFYSIFQSIMIYYFTSSIMDLQIMCKEGFLSDLWVNSLTQFSAIISVSFFNV